MRTSTWLWVLLALAVALVLQTSVFPQLMPIAPNLCLLVVVAAGLVRGEQFAMGLGFAAGLLLDLAPPADHVAGRWALALVLVGLVAGRVRDNVKPTRTTVLLTVGVCSFVGSSVFALTGLIVGDLGADVSTALRVILASVLLDVLIAALAVPALIRTFDHSEPERVLA